MAITNLLSWAEGVDTTRLPNLELAQSDLSTLVSAKVQEFGDKLDQHNVRILSTLADSTAANTQANYALEQVYRTGLEAQIYTDNRVQYLRDEFNGNLTELSQYINDEFVEVVEGLIATRTATLNQALDAAVAEAVNMKATIDTAFAEAQSATDEVLDSVLPLQTVAIEELTTRIETVQSDIDIAFAGFDYTTLVEGLDAVRTRVADQLAPLGLAVPRDPYTAWTNQPDSASYEDKTPIAPYWLKTNDPALGECVELPAGAAVAFGQMAPVQFFGDRVYRARLRVRTVGGGTAGGAKIEIGVTTWAAGVLADAGVRKTAALLLAPSGTAASIYECVFSADLPKLTGQGYAIGTEAADKAVHLSLSGSADKAFFYAIQNGGGATDGQVRIGLLEVKDITEAIDAAKLVENKLDTKFGEASAAIEDLSFVVTEQGTAIAGMQTNLTTGLAGVNATLAQSYYTKSATDAAITAASTQLSTTIGSVSADLANNYYTKTTADSAISAQITSYNAALTSPTGYAGQLSANLSQNYYTKTAVDEAISFASTTLSSSTVAAQATADGKGKVLYSTAEPASSERLTQNLWIDTASGANTPKRWNGSAWSAVSDVAPTTAAVAQVNATLTQSYYTKTLTDSAISAATTSLKSSMEGSSGSIGTLSANLSTNYYTKTGTDTAISASATTLSSQIAVKGKTIYQSTTPDAADQLAQNLWIDTTGGTNAPKRWTGSVWAAVSDTSPTTAAVAQVNATLSTSYYTKTAADAATSAQISSFNASVAGGLAASVSSQQSAIATLEGNASATLAFRTKAGTSGAQLELVSAAGPSGAVSAARITADDIILNGSVKANHLAAGSIAAGSAIIQDLAVSRLKLAVGAVSDVVVIDYFTAAVDAAASNYGNYVLMGEFVLTTVADPLMSPERILLSMRNSFNNITVTRPTSDSVQLMVKIRAEIYAKDKTTGVERNISIYEYVVHNAVYGTAGPQITITAHNDLYQMYLCVKGSDYLSNDNILVRFYFTKFRSTTGASLVFDPDLLTVFFNMFYK